MRIQIQIALVISCFAAACSSPVERDTSDPGCPVPDAAPPLEEAGPGDAGADASPEAGPKGPLGASCIPDENPCPAPLYCNESVSTDLFLDSGINMMRRCTFTCGTSNKIDPALEERCVFEFGGRCVSFSKDNQGLYCVPR